MRSGRMTVLQFINSESYKRAKNPLQREQRDSVRDRLDKIEHTIDKIDYNDTDDLLIVILLSRCNFQSLRTKMYKFAKLMGIKTSNKK